MSDKTQWVKYTGKKPRRYNWGGKYSFTPGEPVECSEEDAAEIVKLKGFAKCTKPKT